jgi:nucleoside-diphosphate-sugar epimerase
LVSVFEVIDILRTVYPNVEISVGPGLLAQADPSGGDRSYQLVLRPNLDISAARKQLGYEPVYAIDRGIPAYAAWLRDGNYL